MSELCHDHSGCLRDIENLKAANEDLWDETKTLRCRMDKILTRINVLLGGVAVACVLLVVNIIVGK